MKVLIVSDTHRDDRNLEKVIGKVGPIDHFIHLGDAEGSEFYYEQIVNCPIHIVSGNCDFYSDLPREEEFMLGKYRVLITHGHYYHVAFGTEELKQIARERGYDIVMYGHTHRPLVESEGGVTIVNPGSISRPRQDKRPSYIFAETDKEGKFDFRIVYMDVERRW